MSQQIHRIKIALTSLFLRWKIQFIGLIILLVSLLFAATLSFAQKERSIYVFPTVVSVDGWNNETAVLRQDLSSQAYFADYSAENSAFLTFGEYEGTTEMASTSDSDTGTPASTEIAPLENARPIENDASTTGALAPTQSAGMFWNVAVAQTLSESQTSTNPTDPGTSSQQILQSIEQHDVAICQTLSLPCHTIEVAGFGITGDITDQPVISARLEVSLAHKGGSSPQVSDRIVVRALIDGNWELLYSEQVGAEDSGVIRGGYLSVPIAITRWSQLANAKVVVEYVRESDADAAVYLDGAWINLTYQDNSDLESDSVLEGSVETTLAAADSMNQEKRRDILQLPDGNSIEFNAQDEYPDQTLIVKTNAGEYQALERGFLYANITNIGAESEAVHIQLHTPKSGGTIERVERFVHDAPIRKSVSKNSSVGYFCSAGWQENGAPDAQQGTYRCAESSEVRTCDALNEEQSNCIQLNGHTTIEEEMQAEDRWSQVPVSDGSYTNDQGLLTRFIHQIVTDFPEDAIPETRYQEVHLKDPLLLEKGQTVYLKISYRVPLNSKGSMYLEANGETGSFGLKRIPWSANWKRKIPLAVSTSDVPEQSAFQISLDDRAGEDFWRTVATSGEDIRIVDEEGNQEIPFSIQSFDRDREALDVVLRLPKHATTTTQVALYFGNHLATGESDPVAPYRTDDLTERYVVMSGAQQEDQTLVLTAEDDVLVLVGDRERVALVKGEQKVYTDIENGDVVYATGAVRGELISVDSKSTLIPVAFAAKDFSVPSSAVEQDVALTTFNQNLPVTFETSNGSSSIEVIPETIVSTPLDGSAPTAFTAVRPFVVAGKIQDGAYTPIYRNSKEDLYAIKQGKTSVVNIIAPGSLTLRCERGTVKKVEGRRALSVWNEQDCIEGDSDSTEAMRIHDLSGPVGVYSHGTNGFVGALALPISEFNSQYTLVHDTDELIAVCGAGETSDIGVFDQLNNVVTQARCVGRDEYPGKAVLKSVGVTMQRGYEIRTLSATSSTFLLLGKERDGTSLSSTSWRNIWSFAQMRGSSAQVEDVQIASSEEVIAGEYRMLDANENGELKDHFNDILLEKREFSNREKPTFRFRYRSQSSGLMQQVRDAFGVAPFTVSQVKLYHQGLGEIQDAEIDVRYGAENEWEVSVNTDKQRIRPGKYVLKVDMEEGGETYHDEFEFYWGVLAINYKKSTYTPNELVDISMAALTDNGNTICDAELRLFITAPGQEEQEQPIERSGKCDGNNVVDVPDYSAEYTVSATGTYQVRLARLDEDGRLATEIRDAITVVDRVPYVIERVGPTRIYPLAQYDMHIRVRALTPFKGNIVEHIPRDFTIIERGNGNLAYGDLGDITAIWGADLSTGEVLDITYRFDAPNLTPYIFELGPLEMNSVEGGGESFVESRAWQIASDAAGKMIIYWDSQGAIPSGWTCMSCNSGDAFFNRLAVGSSTYGGFGGTATHTPTASAVVYSTTNTAVGPNTTNNLNNAIISHSHTLTPQISGGTNYPAYRELRVLRSISAGEPASIPTGAVLPFDVASSSLPTNWYRYDVMDGRYPRAASTTNVNGGSNTHSHTATGTLTTSPEAGLRQNGANASSAQTSHTHTLTSTSTNVVNHEPPYVETLFARLSATSSLANYTIGMWDDTPPDGWQLLSGSGGVFENKFLKASTTYGATGGNETHQHADIVGATSSAPSATANYGTNNQAQASGVHIHSIDITGFSTDAQLPPNIGVIYAKRLAGVSTYDQNNFIFYANTNAITPTDPWPSGGTDLAEGDQIDSANISAAIGSIIRIRIGALIGNSTSTVGRDQFKLQYSEATDCSVALNWNDVAPISSSTAKWRGYNNAAVANNATLPSVLLSTTLRPESYVEENNSTGTPTQIGIGEQAEWDWVVQQNNASPGSTNCFRMTRSDGTPLDTYSLYPTVLTNSAPAAAALALPYDNEKIGTTTPIFYFAASDTETNDLDYQIQVSTTTDFITTTFDKDSTTDPEPFENVPNPSNKAPFNSGDQIKIKSPTTLTNGTTYWWRVRAKDTNASGNWGAWSPLRSFTVDTTVTVSTWFQTTKEQFQTDTLVNTQSTATDQIMITTGNTSGLAYTSAIDFDDHTTGTAWGSFAFTDDRTNGTMRYAVEYLSSTGTWMLIPDSGLSGNSSGFSASPVSLLSVSPVTYSTIRLRATFTDSFGTPKLNDWTVTWGFNVDTPTIISPFDNAILATTTPQFYFYTSDPQSEPLTYEMQISTSSAFTSSYTRVSDTHAGFINVNYATDTQPFNSGEQIRFWLQPADTLTASTTYYWRVRAKDPTGANNYSFYTDTRSFTVGLSHRVAAWYQTADDQWNTNTLTSMETYLANTLRVATSTAEAIIAYGEGTVQTPRFRIWDGSAWSTENSANTVGAQINWVITKASPITGEYILGTLGTDNDVNYQIYNTGVWGNQMELTTSVSNNRARGFDVAYETNSGRALAVSCDGDPDPVYRVWDGTSWSATGTVNITSTSNCEWIRLASNPISNEIMLLERNTGSRYEAQIWNATSSTWGNALVVGGSMSEVAHEGMALAYEKSGYQGVVAVSNGTNANFIWTFWNGSSWAATTTFALQDDFELGNIASSPTSDLLSLCYIDQDTDVGTVRWTGAAWQTAVEHTITAVSKNGRNIDCVYETSSGRSDYIMASYADATTLTTRYRFWNGAAWSAAANVSTAVQTFTDQLTRTATGTILGAFFDHTNADLLVSSWNGATWSAAQTLEASMSVTTSPYGEPFFMAPKNLASRATVISDPIDFDDGVAPSWKRILWNDTENGGSTLTYQVEYLSGTSSWALVPNTDLPGNSAGTTTPPIDISTLDSTTYNQIRLKGNAACFQGSCPYLNDWTVEWAQGVKVSGTARLNDLTTATTSGTVAIAVNGVLQAGKTGTIGPSGAWQIDNVTVFQGNTITVFIQNAPQAYRAVAVAKYSSSGDIGGLSLNQNWLTLGTASSSVQSLSLSELSRYDNSVSGSNDLFHDVTAGGDLNVCNITGCSNSGLYILSGATFRPSTTTARTINTYNMRIAGALSGDANTIKVGGSWRNLGGFNAHTSLVVFNSTSTTQSIDQTGAATTTFYQITFGESGNTGTWNLTTTLTATNTVQLNFGTLAPQNGALTLQGDFNIGASGTFSKGNATTTFSGSVARTLTDNTASKQDLGNVLIDGTAKTVNLGSSIRVTNITIGGDDTLDSVSGNTITVLGNWTNNNVFTPRTGTVSMNATTTGRIVFGASQFYNLNFNGAGGAFSFIGTNATATNDITIATGTVTLATGTLAVGGSFNNSGGLFSAGTGIARFTGNSGGKTIQMGSSSLNILEVAGSGGSWSITDINATTTSNVSILTGTLALPSGTLAVGTNFENLGGTVTAGSGVLRMYAGSGSRTIRFGGSSLAGLEIAGAAAFTVPENNATTTRAVSVLAGSFSFPYASFAIGGSYTNLATVSAGTSSVLFYGASGTSTISAGNNSFSSVSITGAGAFVIAQNATTSSNFALNTASNFVVNSGVTLAVGGTFSNVLGGNATTWTGSTLFLNSGTNYTLNSRTQGGDQYGTIKTGANTQIRTWNSSGSTYTMDTTGSLYSQNHASSSGALNIYGNYSRTSGVDYWSYATDFDGTSLSGSPRQVSVLFGPNATTSFAGAQLQILGTSTATTTINRETTGNYAIELRNSTFNAQYYQLRNANQFGLQLLASTTVTSLRDGDFELGVNGGSMLTVASSTINTNPTAQIFTVRFATSSGITSGFNVTELGAASSFWRFKQHYGNYAGENFDNDPAGNPGYVRWDDSNFVISISGTVYSDAGATPMGSPTCDNVTNVVRVKVDGVGSFAAPCNSSNGTYTVSGVTFTGDTVMTIFLDTNGGSRAVHVTRSAVGDLSNIRLYANRVIVSHEDTFPITIANMNAFDNVDDSDIPFTVNLGSPNTLVVKPDTELWIWNSKTFVPGGNITTTGGGTGNSYDGMFHIDNNAVFTGQSGETHAIGGTFQADSGATFGNGGALFTFNATTTGKSLVALTTLNFSSIQFNGVGGGWSINTPLSVSGTLQPNAGTISGASNITIAGSGLTGSGVINMSGGTVTLSNGGTFGGVNDWTFSGLTLSGSATTTKTASSSITVSGVLTVSPGASLFAGTSTRWVLSGNGTPFVQSGTFYRQSSVFAYTSTTTANITPESYYRLQLAPTLGTPSYTLLAGSLNVLDTLTVGDGSTGVSVNANTNDPTITLLGDLHIRASSTFVGSDSVNLSLARDWLNQGTYTSSGGTVTLIATSTGRTITPSTSTFGNLIFNSATGGWTIVSNSTTTGALSFTQLSNFTQASGTTLEVKGTYTNSVGGSATTWSGATLFLNSGSTYSLNTKSTGADQYDRLEVGANTDVAMWNSAATTTVVNSSGSLYSQDHLGVDGSLNIWGDYVRSSGTDYWSYETDFDGAALGGSGRLVNVRFASSAAYSVSGTGALEAIGTSTATTTIDRQSTGNFSLSIAGGSTTLRRISVTNTDTNGLNISGSAQVNAIDDSRFTLNTNTGSMITVAGATIDANPLRTFSRNYFATSTGISSGSNVRATGSSASAWRFAGDPTLYGNFAGEAYDSDPGGDPGYIIWDDSAARLTVSGNVYSDEGSTPIGGPTCNGVTQNVKLVVQGGTTYTSACDGSTGAYSISNIIYNPLDILTVYLDTNGGARAANVIYDPVTNINNAHLYQNRVIVRHEQSDPITISKMVPYDADQDSDIPFNANVGSPNTLTVRANTGLIVWDAKTFNPGGNVILHANASANSWDGTLRLGPGAVFVSGSADTHTIGGQYFAGNGAQLSSSASSQLTFTASTTGKLIAASSSQTFGVVVFNGAAGGWNVSGIGTTTGNLTISAGAVTLPSATLSLGSSLSVSGGSFDANSGTIKFVATSTGKTITANGSLFNNIQFEGIGGGWTMSDVNATSTGNVTFLRGTVALNSGTLAVRGDFDNQAGSFTHGGGTLRMYAPGTTSFIRFNGSSLGNLNIVGTSSFTIPENFATTTGDVLLSAGTTTFPYQTLAVFGSFNNSAVFNAGTSTLLLSATTGAKTINLGSSSLYNGTVSGAGTFTIGSNATATNNFSINTAGSLTISSPSTLAVGGTFTNLVGGGNTTWTGSTLSLYGTSGYTINTKTLGGDVYDTIRISGGGQIRMWGSSASTVATLGASSLYSQNHAAVSGALNIYGDYVRTSGTDYWSYATDFDGTALGGSPRQANVRFAANATATFQTGATLSMTGLATATTTVDRITSGSYAMTVNAGYFNAQYYQFRNLGLSGLSLLGTTTISLMNNGDFELAQSGGILLSIASSTLDQNASTFHSNVRFATSTGVTSGTNVTRIGTSTGAITFQDYSGNRAGEAFDNDGIDACGQIRWADSQCLFVDQSTYRFRYDDGGEAVPNTEWYDTNWTRRKSVRIINNATSTYTNVQVKLPVQYDADMKADFSDVRFTDNSGTTSIPFWIAEDKVNSASTTIWVKVPLLTASSYADVYMYYGNSGAANTGSSGTSTFKFFDDFEDNNITEYSGDTTLFANSSSFNFERSYGLAVSTGNQSSQATDGIFNLSASAGQGSSLRFFQYIDATKSDEPCMLFAVQSPGTTNNNYAVCLTPFGSDKLTIAKNAVYNGRSAGATELATTSVSYTTGWYEALVDWLSGGRIDVRVNDSTGAFFASTTAVDSTYTTGAFGFTYWSQNGGWDIPFAREYYAVQPSVTFGLEQQSGGATWKAAENSVLVNQLPLQNVRVRYSIKNSGGSPTTKNYRLQIASKGASPNCESVPTGNYSDVPTTSGGCGSSVACMAASTNISDRASTTQLLTLSSGYTFAYGQILEDPSNQTGNVPLNNLESTEVEFTFQLTAFANQPSYCMRTTNAGTALDNYSKVAEIRPLYAPTISNWAFNNDSTIALTEGTTTRIFATGTVSDLNGYTDIVAATSTFYRSGVSNGRFCSGDQNNCYQIASSSCLLSACAGNSCTLSCSADLQYFADPTDVVSSFASQFWDAFVDVWDNSNSHTTSSSTQDVYTLSALSVPASINYGSVVVGADTGSSNASTSVTNTGNKLLDLNLGGDNLRAGSSQIPYNNQKYATTSFTYSSCPTCSTLAPSTTPAYFGLGVPKPTSTNSVFKDIFWGLAVPLGVSATTHNGLNDFLAY